MPPIMPLMLVWVLSSIANQSRALRNTFEDVPEDEESASFLAVEVTHTDGLEAAKQDEVGHEDGKEWLAVVPGDTEQAMAFAVRACLLDLATRFEELVQEGFIFPKHMPLPTKGSLLFNIDKYWGADSISQGLLKSQGLLEMRLAARQAAYTEALEIKETVRKEWWFSIEESQAYCKKNFHKAGRDLIQGCVDKAIDRGMLVKKWFHFWTKHVSVNITDEDKQTLKDATKNLQQLEFDSIVLDRGNLEDIYVSTGVGTRQLVRKMSEVDIPQTKEHIRSIIGFDIVKTLEWCDAESSAIAKILGRVYAEFFANVHEEGGLCIENSESYCPEGSMPDRRRNIDMEEFSKLFGSILATFGPVGMLAAGFVGLLNPVAAGYLAAFVAFPGSGAVTAATIGAAKAGKMGQKVCKCFMRDCEYVDGACKITSVGLAQNHSTSQNPFFFLPYQGQRCVTTEKNGGTTCEFLPCRDEDYSHPLKEDSIFGEMFGTVGETDSGVYNCLSTTGKQDGNLLMSENLMSKDGNRSDNNPMNRLLLFCDLFPDANAEICRRVG